MINVKFKNLEKSDLIKTAVLERFEPVVEKFPDLKMCKISVTAEMENSPAQPGPDFFNVKVHISSGRYSGITLIKGNANLYVALADVVEHALEVLNRYGDKLRVKERTHARKIETESGPVFEFQFAKETA